jgi:hypothetical protein
VHDGQLRAPEGRSQPLQSRENFGSLRDFEWLAIEEVLLHINRNQGHRPEIGPSVVDFHTLLHP